MGGGLWRFRCRQVSLIIIIIITAIGPLAYSDVLQNLPRHVNFGPYFIHMSLTLLADK